MQYIGITVALTGISLTLAGIAGCLWMINNALNDMNETLKKNIKK